MPTDLTKREYYATHALSGLLASQRYGASNDDQKKAATDAVSIADQLIAALEATNEGQEL